MIGHQSITGKGVFQETRMEGVFYFNKREVRHLPQTNRREWGEGCVWGVRVFVQDKGSTVLFQHL